MSKRSGTRAGARARRWYRGPIAPAVPVGAAGFTSAPPLLSRFCGSWQKSRAVMREVLQQRRCYEERVIGLGVAL